jgi:hypothetical protein
MLIGFSSPRFQESQKEPTEKTTKYIAFSKEFNGKSMTQIGLGYLAYFDPLSYSRKDNDDDI